MVLSLKLLNDGWFISGKPSTWTASNVIFFCLTYRFLQPGIILRSGEWYLIDPVDTSTATHYYQNGLSYGNVHKATTLIKLYPYPINVMHKLQDPEKEKLLHYCQHRFHLKWHVWLKQWFQIFFLPRKICFISAVLWTMRITRHNPQRTCIHFTSSHCFFKKSACCWRINHNLLGGFFFLWNNHS